MYEVLTNDDDKKILEEIGRSVGDKNYWTWLDADKLFSVLAKSKAAIYKLWQIFHNLDENKKNLTS